RPCGRTGPPSTPTAPCTTRKTSHSADRPPDHRRGGVPRSTIVETVSYMRARYVRACTYVHMTRTISSPTTPRRQPSASEHDDPNPSWATQPDARDAPEPHPPTPPHEQAQTRRPRPPSRDQRATHPASHPPPPRCGPCASPTGGSATPSRLSPP